MKLRFVFSLFVAFQFFGSANAQVSEQDQKYWQWMQSNLIAQERLLNYHRTMVAADTLITHVNILMLPDSEILEDAALFIQDGKIVWIGATSDAPVVSDVQTIDAEGGFLVPGLMDMHVHTMNDADYLLQLSMGITTIREMNGFKWLLNRQQAVDNNELFAPNMFVVSQIFNSNDLNGFAIPVTTPEEAVTEVRRAAREGYGAIKIHNGLALDVFQAIAAEAQRVGLPLVGHIPVSATVEEAIGAGMRTSEHLKGYIIDNTLQISEEDWVTASIDTEMYIAPTFSTYRQKLRGNDSLELFYAQSHLVPPYRRLLWMAVASQEVTEKTILRQAAFSKQEEIFKKLLPLNLRWLAGTDAGDYDQLVPGLSLIEELEIMEGFGLSPLETLKAATTNAADAMDWQERTGRIAVGLQADLILLDENPLETVSNLRSLRSVMLRGIWIDDPVALRITTEDYIGTTYDYSGPILEDAVERAEGIMNEGYVLSDRDLGAWAYFMRKAGREDLSDRLGEMRQD